MDVPGCVPRLPVFILNTHRTVMYENLLLYNYLSKYVPSAQYGRLRFILDVVLSGMLFRYFPNDSEMVPSSNP